MGADFTIAVGGAGLLSSPNPLGGSFDLNDLDMHNFVSSTLGIASLKLY